MGTMAESLYLTQKAAEFLDSDLLTLWGPTKFFGTPKLAETTGLMLTTAGTTAGHTDLTVKMAEHSGLLGTTAIHSDLMGTMAESSNLSGKVAKSSDLTGKTTKSSDLTGKAAESSDLT